MTNGEKLLQDTSLLASLISQYCDWTICSDCPFKSDILNTALKGKTRYDQCICNSDLDTIKQWLESEAE